MQSMTLWPSMFIFFLVLALRSFCSLSLCKTSSAASTSIASLGFTDFLPPSVSGAFPDDGCWSSFISGTSSNSKPSASSSAISEPLSKTSTGSSRSGSWTNKQQGEVLECKQNVVLCTHFKTSLSDSMWQDNEMMEMPLKCPYIF